MNLRRSVVPLVALVLALAGCDKEPEPCSDPDAMAADVDLDGAMMECIEHMGEQWDEMTPEERDAFLND